MFDEKKAGSGQTERAYRDRIYGAYNSGRHEAVAPATLAGLNPRAPYLTAMIRKHFPAQRDSAVLDLGCGYGAVVYFAREMGYPNVRGVDGSAEQVRAAARLGIPGVEEADLLQVLCAKPDSSLDVVVAFDVIEHFTRDELLPFVDEVNRVLRPGGRWLIHVPNGESPFGSRIRFGDLTHELAFTRTSLGQLLLTSGFTDVRCFEDAPIVHGAKSAIRWVLWKGFRGMLRLYTIAETGNLASDAVFSQNMLAVATK
jgi:SAM-dependent methyltransferase